MHKYTEIIYTYTPVPVHNNIIPTVVSEFLRSRLYGRRQYRTLAAHDDVANFYRQVLCLNVWQQHVWTGVRADRHFGRKYNILFYFSFVLFPPPETRNNVHSRLSLARAFNIFYTIIVVIYIYVCINPLRYTLYIL